MYPHEFEYQMSMKVVVYCTFYFYSYPFDSHECDFNFGASTSYSEVLMLDDLWIRYRKQLHKFGNKPIEFDPTRLPFYVSLKTLENFIHNQGGHEYAFVGMRMTLTRNWIGLLIGGYYGPTLIFSLLSLVSFSINPDIVSN